MKAIECPSCLHTFVPKRDRDLDNRAGALGFSIALVGLSCWWWDSSGWGAAQVFLGALGLFFGIASFAGTTWRS